VSEGNDAEPFSGAETFNDAVPFKDSENLEASRSTGHETTNPDEPDTMLETGPAAESAAPSDNQAPQARVGAEPAAVKRVELPSSPDRSKSLEIRRIALENGGLVVEASWSAKDPDWLPTREKFLLVLEGNRVTDFDFVPGPGSVILKIAAAKGLLPEPPFSVKLLCNFGAGAVRRASATVDETLENQDGPGGDPVP
jgi:hypothetical protein